MTCKICDGTGWVCEKCGTCWDILGPFSHNGPGMPCVCNPNADLDMEWDYVIASTEPEKVRVWEQ